MQYTHDVIIIGAGIVGSAMALAAAQQGLQVALLDKQAPSPVTPSMGLRVSNINFISEQFLNTLGVIFPKDRCGTFNSIQIFQEDYLATLNFSAKILGLSYLGSIIENNVLISLMTQSKIETFWPVNLEKIEFTDKAVLLSSPEIGALCAPLIIGAEGAHSWLRERCAIMQDEKSYQQTALVAHIVTQKPHEHRAYQRFLAQGPLAYLPLCAAEQSSIVWSSTPSHIDYLMNLDNQAFADEVGRGMMYQLGTVELFSERASFPLVMRHAKHYIAPRVVLVGDAIHTLHPLAGQGANLGLMDVACLAKLLLWAKQQRRDIGSFALLRRYERERRYANTLVLRAVALLAQNQKPFPFLRAAGMQVLEHSTLIKRAMMHYAQGA